MHEAVAVALLAAVLNPRVQVPYGGINLTLDFWILILSGSGLGRSTLVRLAYPIVNASGLATLVRGNTWGSGPGFYEDLAKNSVGLFIWGELAQMLKTLSQPQFNGAKEWLTDRFDETRVPDDVHYRTGRRSSTPPIVFSEPPRLNILATSSVDWFVSSLAREDTTGGFVPRWLIVRVVDTNRVIPIPKESDTRLVKPLAAHMAAAVKLKGAADLSRVEPIYCDWYLEADRRFKGQPNRALAVPFFNRVRAMVRKLAVIFEVAASCSLSVSPAAMERAVAWAAATEETIFKLLPTGMTADGFAVDQMEQRVQQAGAPGMTQTELTRAFQGDKYRDRKERLTTLVQAGKLSIYERPTAGRKAFIYVHSDFRAQHEKEFPHDTLKM